MLGCFISLLIVAIVAVIGLVVIEAILTALGVAIPARIMPLVRLLIGLLVLLYGLQCFFGAGHPVVLWR
jgi:hypothetical protein